MIELLPTYPHASLLPDAPRARTENKEREDVPGFWVMEWV